MIVFWVGCPFGVGGWSWAEVELTLFKNNSLLPFPLCRGWQAAVSGVIWLGSSFYMR